MCFQNSTFPTSKTILLFFFCLAATVSFSQKIDSTKRELNFGGTVSATNNGFSLVPTFSLGKPALMTNLSLSGKGRFSFEPMFWYSMLDFKPWSFIFISRYKLVRREKFNLIVGTHLPAVNFTTTSVVKDSVRQDLIEARRFFPVGELILGYRFSKYFSLGAYILFGKGLDKSASTTNTFVSLRPDFDFIPISEKYFLKFNPQFYYLKMNENDGFYTAASLTLARKNCPFSISAMANRVLKSEINVKDFDWNVSLTYAFAKHFVKK